MIRALEASFRHRAPIRKSFGPVAVTAGGNAFSTSAPLILDESQAPSWGVTGPTGFDFSYAIPEEDRDSFFRFGVENVPVKLFILYPVGLDSFVEQSKWRFEGVITSGTYEPHNGLFRCTATPLSRTRQLQAYVPGWSNQEQLDLTDGEDTLLRWTRAARRIDYPVEEI